MNFGSENFNMGAHEEIREDFPFIPRKILQSFRGADKITGQEDQMVFVSRSKKTKPDYLSLTGMDFRANIREAKRDLDVYGKVIKEKYGYFINKGFKSEPLENIWGEIEMTPKPLEPMEGVSFFAKKFSLFDDKKYKAEELNTASIYNPEAQTLWINADNPHKAEVAVKGALERYAYKGTVFIREKGRMVMKKGFSRQELDTQSRPYKREYKELYDGLILALAEDVVHTVTNSNPRMLNRLQESKESPLVMTKEGNPEKALMFMNAASFVRDFVNTNEPGNYDPSKDALLCDLFIHGEMKESKAVMNAKCGKGTFELFNDELKKLTKLKDKKADAQWDKIVDMMIWMKKQKGAVVGA